MDEVCELSNKVVEVHSRDMTILVSVAHAVVIMSERYRRCHSLLRRGLFASQGGWEKEKEIAWGTMGRGKRVQRPPAFSLFPSSSARFLFFDVLLFLLGYPAGASAEERADTMKDIYHRG